MNISRIYNETNQNKCFATHMFSFHTCQIISHGAQTSEFNMMVFLMLCVLFTLELLCKQVTGGSMYRLLICVAGIAGSMQVLISPPCRSLPSSIQGFEDETFVSISLGERCHARGSCSEGMVQRDLNKYGFSMEFWGPF